MIPSEKPDAYRPDVDGLRALAVTIVILFHVFREWVPGGFIGVDVFFVISGYLISRMLLEDLRSGRFTFLGFYANRLRRLTPALILVLLGVWGIGWFVLLGDEFKNLGKHIVSGATYTANFLLWSEASYFDKAANTKPLLHLWSLGIEEQFYLIWPALLLFWTRRRLSLKGLIAGAFVLSFGLNVITVRTLPVESFYFLPWRFWELLVGCGLAIMEKERGKLYVAPVLADFLVFASITTLVLMAFLFHRGAPYPGWWALLPTASAFSLIAAGPSSRLSRWILSCRPAAFVGRISYPLYLWHWPLFSFFLIAGRGTVLPLSKAVLVAISFVLAWLTWRFIETPIRTCQDTKRIVYPALGIIASVSILGFVTVSQQGFKFRLPGFEEAQESLATGVGPEWNGLRGECGLGGQERKLAVWCHTDARGKPNAAMIGDSHAAALFSGFLVKTPDTMRWMLIGRSGCPPILGVNVDDDQDCARFNESVFKSLEADGNIKTVVMTVASRLLTSPTKFEPNNVLLQKTPEDLVFQGISSGVSRLQRAGKKVILTIDNPAITASPELCVARPVQFENAIPWTCKISREEYDKRTVEYRSLIRRLQNGFPSLNVYDPTPILCGESDCSVLHDNRALYCNGDHLTDFGSYLVANDFFKWFSSHQ